MQHPEREKYTFLRNSPFTLVIGARGERTDGNKGASSSHVIKPRYDIPGAGSV